MPPDTPERRGLMIMEKTYTIKEVLDIIHYLEKGFYDLLRKQIKDIQSGVPKP